MSKAIRKRKCQQCGLVMKTASLELLLSHMQSSSMCKDAIMTCESCLMSFPDETSLLKHMSAKKQCLDRHNMGSMDPSIVLTTSYTNQLTEGDGQILSVAYEPSKRTTLTATAVLNSHSTYSFRRHASGVSNEGIIHNLSDRCLKPVSSSEGHLRLVHTHSPSRNKVITESGSVEVEFELSPDADECLSSDNNSVSNVNDGSDLSAIESMVSTSSVDGDMFDNGLEHHDEPGIALNIEEMDGLKILSAKMRRLQMSSFNIPTDIQMIMDLYLRTIGRGTSLSAFDDCLNWAITHSLINCHVMSRKPLLDHLTTAIYGKEYLQLCRPKQHRVHLCTGRIAEVTVFDIRTVILDMLCNEDLMKRQNLVFGNDDITEVDAGVRNIDVYDDVNSGTWWRDSAQKMKEDYPALMNTSVLWPIILFIDGVAHGEFTNLSQEPVLMTFSAFNRNIRNKPQAWRPLAYIDYKGNVKGKVSPVMALNEYHEVLQSIFSCLIDVQTHGMNWTMKFPGEDQKEVVLFFPLQFIIGDCEGHDKLCGRFKSHNNTPGLVRDCDVLTAQGDDPFHQCVFYTQTQMDRYSVDELKQRSFHKLHASCLNQIDFGDSNQGVHGAVLPENHHAFLMGCAKEIGDIYPMSLSAAAKIHTDNVISFMIETTRLPPLQDLPTWTAFRTGIDKVGKLKAKERLGKLFVLYCIMMSSSYVKFLHDHPKNGEDGDVYLQDVKGQMKTIEKMLTFHDWLFADSHEKTSIDPDVENGDSKSLVKIRHLMQSIKLYFPRPNGMGWKLTKFHHLLHFPHNIQRHGSSLNFDGGRPEFFGKYFCKDHTTRTQRRQISLSRQTAQRYFESSCVREAERLLSQSRNLTYKEPCSYNYLPIDSKSRTVRHDRFNDRCILKAKLCLIELCRTNFQQVIVQWTNKSYSDGDGFGFAPVVYHAISSRIWNSRNGGRLSKDGILHCYSECVLTDGTTIRSHPHFRSERPWNDWVLVKWNEVEELLPARVLLLFQICVGDIENYNIVGDTIVEHKSTFLDVGKNYALVETVTGEEFNYRTRINVNRRYHLKSSIAVRYTLEKNLRLIEVESIESITFVVMNNVGSLGDAQEDGVEDKTIIMFRDRSLWQHLFLQL